MDTTNRQFLVKCPKNLFTPAGNLISPSSSTLRQEAQMKRFRASTQHPLDFKQQEEISTAQHIQLLFRQFLHATKDTSPSSQQPMAEFFPFSRV